MGTDVGSEATTDFLFDLGHAEVLFSLVVGEGDVEVVDKPQGLILTLTHTLEKILDFGLFTPSPPARLGVGLNGIEGLSFIYQDGVLVVDLVTFMGTESGLAVGFGEFNTSMGIQEKVAELMRPLLACELESGFQFSQEVGIAQGVGTVRVAKIGVIAIVDRNTPEVGEHIDSIESLATPAGIDVKESESISRNHMQPGIVVDANAGFIAVYHRGF